MFETLTRSEKGREARKSLTLAVKFMSNMRGGGKAAGGGAADKIF
jgi:hypothetical protein